MDKRRFFSRLYFVLLTCLLILPITKDVSGAEWKRYATGTGLLFFYDAESISVLPNNIIQVWTKHIPESEEARVKTLQDDRKLVPTLPDNWSYTKALIEINCKDRTSKNLSSIDYNTEDELIDSTTIKHPSLTHISPDSMGEALYKAVCVKKGSKKKGR